MTSARKAVSLRMAACLAASFGLALAMAGPMDAAESSPVLQCGPDEISPAEFRFFASQERAVQPAAASPRPALMATEAKDGPAAAEAARIQLIQRTIKRTKREKAEQALFRELGLLSDIRFTAFLAQLEATNRERAAARQRGQVIYGPVNYEPIGYYAHWMAGMRIAAKAGLAASRFDLSEATLRRFHEQHRDRYRSPATASLEVFTVSAEGTGGPAATRREVEALARKLEKAIRSGKGIEALVTNSVRGIKVARESFLNSTGDRLSESLTGEAIAAGALRLRAGKCKWVPMQDGRFQIVKCIDRQPETPREFAEVAGTVRTHAIDEQYAQLLAERTAQSPLTIHQPALDALTLP